MDKMHDAVMDHVRHLERARVVTCKRAEMNMSDSELLAPKCSTSGKSKSWILQSKKPIHNLALLQ